MSTPLRLAIFDVDGTLVDSQAHILAAMTLAFAAVGLPCPARADILGIVGLSLPVAIERLASAADPATRDGLVEGYKSAYMTLRQNGAEAAMSPFYPGAREALDRLHRVPDVLLGIATGKSRRGLDHLLAAHSLTDRFVTRQVADDHPSKPHPAMLMQALGETGVARDQAVMIGDSEYDMEMGRAAGVTSVGVSWGYHSRERLTNAGADYIVKDYPALIATLAGLWRMEL